ncbi:mechanosensitive ion channel domain-containing protein [Endothiovibrio diazotrophicus]
MVVRWFAFVALSLLPLLAAAAPAAPPEHPAPSPTPALSVEQRLAALDPGRITSLTIEQARLEVESARLRLEGVLLDRKGAENSVGLLRDALKEARAGIAALRAAPEEGEAYTQKLRAAEAALAERQAELEKEQARLQGLVDQEGRAREAQTAARRWLTGVEGAWRDYRERSRREAFADVEARLTAEERRLQGEAARLNERLANLSAEDEDARRRLRAEITDAEERARLQRVSLRRHRFAERLDALRAAPVAEEEGALSRAEEEGAELAAELADGRRLLDEKVALINQQRELLVRQRELENKGAKRAAKEGPAERLLRRLAEALQEEAGRYGALAGEAGTLRTELAERHDRLVSRGLTVRQRLPLFGEQRERVLGLLARAPGEVARHMAELATTSFIGLAALDVGSWLLLLLAAVAVVFGGRRLYRSLKGHGAGGGALPESTVALLAELTLRLLPGSVLLALLLLIAWAAQPPASQLYLLLLLAALWLVITISKGVAWVFLVLPGRGGAEGEGHARLYRSLRRVAWVVGVSATLLLVAHWSGPPREVLDLLDRVFFLLLLAAVPLLASIRSLIDDGLNAHYAGRFWLAAARLLMLLVPLLVLVAAVAGVLGYLNLSRALLGSIGWVGVVSAGWLFAVGLLRDAANGLKNFAVSHSRYGLLWAQGVIDPARKLGNLLLAGAALVLLFHLLGWGADSAVAKVLRAALDVPLIKVGETVIRVQGVLLTLLVLAVLVWLGRWVREITYRWLYTSVKDLGIRQSLSVFTQYAVVGVGGFIALQALNIDLTAFAVFAGALGVGLGLGLQGVANNFISGLLLLAEQPLRTGDLVVIGGTEGEVTRFGIRSLTIKTWDNQEMIIPNSEVVSGSFTNWTHSDNVMRTVLTIGVSYDADPHRVGELIRETVSAHPAVLAEPKLRVLLWEFADSSVNFRVQYFTDLRAFSRLEVVSEMHFAIWDALKANGITIPYPQRDLYVKEWPRPPVVPATGGGQHEAG